MKTIQVTLQERWVASQHKVHGSKKTYNRKSKHKKTGSKQDPFYLLNK
jgi:hypothetical protein